jgi:signal transduction histidine kinase
MQKTSPSFQITPSEAIWVESESILQLRQRVQGTRKQALATVFLLLVVLITHIPLTQWFIWVAVHALAYITRSLLIGKLHVSSTSIDDDQAKAFYLSHIRFIAAIGFVWGSTVYLFSSKEPSVIDAACFTMVIIYGVGSAINLSIHYKSLILFIRGYCIGLLCAFIARMLFDMQIEVMVTNIFLIMVVVLLAIILEKFGKQLNHEHINSLLLHFRNNQLIRNLTQEKQIAIDAVASKNRMLASAAHDMRQPVLALDIYAGWLADEPASSADIAPKIIASTKAVIELFDSMFDISRLSEGEISTRMEAVNLAELISELYVHYEPLATSKNLSLKTRTIEGTVFTDYILLTRVMGNLVSNAIKYTQTGGVLIACRNTVQGVNIEVWDTGVGIESDQQALVFKEFYKNPSNPGTSDGFGLGLAIVTQLADLIGAKLALRSRRGRGTVVSLKLGKII